MPKPSTRRRPAKKSSRKKETPLLAVQKQILASSKAQEITPEMTVLDIPRMRIKRLKVHTIQVKLSPVSITTQFGVITYTAANIPDVASYALVFDQFRIAQVSLDFYAVTGNTDNLATAIDYTDSVVPTTLVSVLDTETSYMSQAPYFSRTYGPTYQNANAGTGDPSNISSAFIPIQSGSSTTSPVPNITIWGALKWATLAAPSGAIYSYVSTLVLSFRSSD